MIESPIAGDHRRAISTTSQLRTHRAVVLRPPGPLTGRRWVAELLSTRTRIGLSRAAAYVLIVCAKSMEFAGVLAKLDTEVGLEASVGRELVDDLVRRGYLVAQTEPDADEELLARWEQFGWSAAAAYHLSTFDYEFLDYRGDGREQDNARMRAYRRERPDAERSKTLPDAAVRVRLPSPTAELVEVPFDMVAGTQFAPADALMRLLSITFGVTRRIRSRHEDAAPYLLRTSPSGGARHPTEAYVAVVGNFELAPGWYHVAMESPELELVDRAISAVELERLCFGPVLRAPFTPEAVIILTTIFERNMYRYREPRTYRTVYMDAGHLVATCEAAARGLGLRTFAHCGIDQPAIEARLGVDPLQEGAVIGIAVGRRTLSEWVAVSGDGN